MPLRAGEKIRIILGRRNMTLKDLSDKLGQSPQNISSKINRDNFSENDLRTLAQALDCTCNISFTMNDTGEVI